MDRQCKPLIYFDGEDSSSLVFFPYLYGLRFEFCSGVMRYHILFCGPLSFFVDTMFL
jgi:hypothetical protein